MLANFWRSGGCAARWGQGKSPGGRSRSEAEDCFALLRQTVTKMIQKIMPMSNIVG